MAVALSGVTPEGRGPYSTEFTEALDLAVITPATVRAGVLILRRDPQAHPIAVSLLVPEVLLAPLIIAQTVLQLRAGATFTGLRSSDRSSVSWPSPWPWPWPRCWG